MTHDWNAKLKHRKGERDKSIWEPPSHSVSVLLPGRCVSQSSRSFRNRHTGVIRSYSVIYVFIILVTHFPAPLFFHGSLKIKWKNKLPE